MSDPEFIIVPMSESTMESYKEWLDWFHKQQDEYNKSFLLTEDQLTDSRKDG